jgi:phosphoribosylglycinamide formyltransferase-1
VKLGVLVSGRGSNLEAVLDAVADGRLPHLQPVLVISNRPGVRALAVAAAHDVPSRVIRRRDFAAGERDAEIGRALAAAGVELALLAGYDQRLHGAYFAAFGGRTVNIHPSLLPRHGGPGMVGSAVHAAVLAAGDHETGVTVHDVIPALDAGRVLRQERVPVRPGETADELAARVLAVEHRTLVAVLGDLSGGRTDGGSSASMTAAPAAADVERG